MRRTWTRIGAAAALSVALVAGAGCGSGSTAKPMTEKEKFAGHDHPHEGPHHGALVEWGEEEYHAEFTVDHKAKEATVYVLDGSAKKAAPIDAKELTLTLKATPPVTVKLTPKPDAGDPAGQSSRFTGTHEALGKEQEFEGTVSGVVNGKPYSGDFKEEPHDHKH